MNYESANFASTFKSTKRKHEKHKQGGALQKDHKSTSLFLLFMTPFCLYIFHDTILLLKRQKQDKTLTYFHCRELGCFKKDCKKYHAWREKKGNFITLVCIEVNLASGPTDTWWLDYGATIHVSMSMQGCLHRRKPRTEEKYVFTSNDTLARVEGIKTFRLLLNTSHFVDLIDTLVVSTFRRNLLFFSTMDKFDY